MVGFLLKYILGGLLLLGTFYINAEILHDNNFSLLKEWAFIILGAIMFLLGLYLFGNGNEQFKKEYKKRDEED